MDIDHFDGGSLRSKSDQWLISAIADAHLRARDCKDSPAHEDMWLGLAEKYATEQVRRDLKAFQNFYK